MVGAHCAISTRPISVEPVNVSMRTSGFEVSSLPIALALPVMTLNTPFGIPASSASAASARAVRGVSEAGLHTTVHPTASAGATFRVIMAAGKFHGVMAATTPTGCLMTMTRASALKVGMVSP